MLSKHILENICKGDKNLANWLIDFMAHMVQRPWEKPRVSIVLQSHGKGTGKNVFVSCINTMLRPENYFESADNNTVAYRFNNRLERCLSLTLNEAFWGGNKQAESKLKALITEPYHNIERKGVDIITVRNVTRVFIMGNEDWLVPASADERRFAVFEVGEKMEKER